MYCDAKSWPSSWMYCHTGNIAHIQVEATFINGGEMEPKERKKEEADGTK